MNTVFINLSNHHSCKWTESQRNKALEMGNTIINMPFPAIDPNASASDLLKLVNETLGEIFETIKGLATRDSLCIHVMGEQGFTYTFVSQCKRLGILTVHSTTERIVTENSQTGEKISQFNFVQFRPY